jgi:nucleoside-diphosphate-sugar epimerase
MRVLVAGDRGYLSAVIATLVQRADHDVVGLGARWYDACRLGVPASGHTQRTRDTGDVRPDALVGLDAIVNARLSSTKGDSNPKAAHSLNADGAIHVGRMAKAAGVSMYRFSCPARCMVPLPPKATRRRAGRYAASKAAATAFADSRSEQKKSRSAISSADTLVNLHLDVARRTP